MDIFNGNATQANNVYQVHVKPDMAEDFLLKRNLKNRKISEALVNRLVTVLVEGRWVVNGQPIVFDDSGALIDGQHRLTAIVRSKRSAECLIVTNISDPMAFHTIDDGKKRGLSCNLSAMGMEYSRNIASIGKLLYGFCNSKDLTRFVISTHTEQNIIMAEFIKNTPEIREAAMLAHRTSKLCNVKVMGAALVVLLRINSEHAKDFHNMLYEAEFPYKDHPVKYLRERFFKDRLSTNKMNNLERLAIIFRVWNHYLSGKSVKDIRWSRRSDPDKKFPIPKGWIVQ